VIEPLPGKCNEFKLQYHKKKKRKKKEVKKKKTLKILYEDIYEIAA
jgi:hypothetical protein